MPVLTREKAKQQKMARNGARLTTSSPSASDSSLTSSNLSPYSSDSYQCSSNSSRPSSNPSRSSSNSSRSSSNPCYTTISPWNSLSFRDDFLDDSLTPNPDLPKHVRPDECWVPTMDEISRAEPHERALLIAELTQEGKYGPITPAPEERKTRTTPRHSKSPTKRSCSSPLKKVTTMGSQYPLEDSTPLAPQWDELDDSVMVTEDQEMYPDCIANVPDSPVTSSFSISHGAISEEVTVEWVSEDQEMEGIATEKLNNKFYQLGYDI